MDCGFHDAGIIAINYEKDNNRLEIEMSLSDCLHGLGLSEKENKKQKISVLLNGVADGENILSECVLNENVGYYFIQHRISVDAKINLEFQIRAYGNGGCREFWINLQCDKILFIEKR